MECIELFSGAGGLAIGLDRSGFNHTALIEWNHDACETLRFNLGKSLAANHKCNVIEGDIRSIGFKEFHGKIDFIAGGPPCQPFSLGGKHKAFLDERDMFPQAIRSIREAQPKAFLFENVKGLTRKAFATYLEYIMLQLQYPDFEAKQGEEWAHHLARLEKIHTKGNYSGLQYNLVFQVVNAADYGVPQRRERVIFVGFRSNLGIEWSFPKQTHSEAALHYEQCISKDYWDRHELPKKNKNCEFWGRARFEKDDQDLKLQPWRTIRDAISDLPDPGKASYEWKMKGHTFQDGAKIYPGHTGSYIDLPSKTIKAGGHGVPGGENMILYPDGSVRYLSVREAARIQTFPDAYDISGSWTEAMRQIGNAVPVTLAETIGNSIKLALEQDQPTQTRKSQ